MKILIRTPYEYSLANYPERTDKPYNLAPSIKEAFEDKSEDGYDEYDELVLDTKDKGLNVFNPETNIIKNTDLMVYDIESNEVCNISSFIQDWTFTNIDMSEIGDAIGYNECQFNLWIEEINKTTSTFQPLLYWEGDMLVVNHLIYTNSEVAEYIVKNIPAIIYEKYHRKPHIVVFDNESNGITDYQKWLTLCEKIYTNRNFICDENHFLFEVNILDDYYC